MDFWPAPVDSQLFQYTVKLHPPQACLPKIQSFEEAPALPLRRQFGLDDILAESASYRVVTAAVVLATALCGGCAAPSEPPGPQETYVTRNGVELAAELAPSAPVVAALDFGTPVQIVNSHRVFVRVRTPAGYEGWAPKSMLLDPEMRRRMELLKERTADFPGQGSAHALDTLNVHIEPYRWSPTLYQLRKDEGVKVLRKQLVARLPHEPDPNERPPQPEKQEDWYLVRLANGYAGWLLAARVYSGIPIEVAQYAEGRRIVAYFPIGEAYDSDIDATKKTWLWVQAAQPNRPHDFDRLRVFQWRKNRRAYATIKLETGFVGYLPIEVMPRLETKHGTGVGFAIPIAKGERRLVRTYVHVRNRVYRVGEEPALGIPELPRIERRVEAAPEPKPPTLMERFKKLLAAAS